MASEKSKLDQPHLPEAEQRRVPARSRDRVIVRKLDRSTLDQPQTPTTGINAIIGKWPGDESEEEILALLEEMS